MSRPWDRPAPDAVYLDWNATSPPHPDVVSAMRAAAASAWGNPSSVHAAGRRARECVEGAREALGRLVGVDPRDVVFTSGGTEANNLALHRAPGLVTSRLEHPSVTRLAERLANAGRPVRWLSALENGQVDGAELGRAAAELPPGAWLAVQAVNHETGVIQPLAELIAEARALGLRVHVDAVQAVGKLGLDALAAADSVAVAAHKIRGPKGIGALCVRERAKLESLLAGGSQERGLRPGTVDPIAAAGFWVALEIAARGPERHAELAPRRDALERALLPFATLNGSAPRLAHVSNLSFTDRRGDELVAALDLCGVHVSSGSACSAGSAEPSAVIAAMRGKQRALEAVRISLGESVTDDQVRFAKAAFFHVVGVRGAATSSDG